MPTRRNSGGSIKNGFGADSVGYAFSDETANALYLVWDDGAREHLDKAQGLYNAFADIIDAYTPAANDYLAKIADTVYEAQVTQAKANGWDASIIVNRPLTFPYAS